MRETKNEWLQNADTLQEAHYTDRWKAQYYVNYYIYKIIYVVLCVMRMQVSTLFPCITQNINIHNQ